MDQEGIKNFKEKIANETVELFQEIENLYDARDFYLERFGDWYAVKFASVLGYRPIWKYEPMVRYNFLRKAWEIKIGLAHFFTSGCPFYELVCELRGYTLPGTIMPDSVVLDAGPWNGISGMYFSAAAREGRVIFLEPDDASADFISNEIKINGFSNTKLVRKAIYSRSGEVNFQSRPLGVSSIVEHGSAVVEAVSLGRLISEYVPEGIDFFKVDIEGAETVIADDLAKYISENHGSWAAIASYHKVGDVKSCVALEKCFSRYPDLVFKTAYPYHQTTFVANVKNTAVVDGIRKITSVEIGFKAVQRDLKRQGLEPLQEF